MRRKGKRFLSALLACALMISLIPFTALAEDNTQIATITINGTSKAYSSLEDAVKDASAGDTLNISAGTLTVSNDPVVISKRVNLVGAGADQTTVVGQVQYSFSTEQNAALTVSDLTIKAGTDSVQGLRIFNGVQSNYFTKLSLVINVKDCNFDGWMYGITMNTGAHGCTLNVDDCNFMNTQCAVSYVNDSSTEGQVTENTLNLGTITIPEWGYTVQNFNNGAAGTTLDSKYYATPEDFSNGTATDEVPTLVENPVAKVGNTFYTDLQAAIDAAGENGQPVVLLDDYETTKALVITKPITINGGNHTITANKCVGLYIEDDLDSLTINDLKLQGVLSENEKAGEGGTGSFMGIGTYDGCYGVEDLQLNNVTIDGFSYGLYFGQNPSGSTDPVNKNPVTVTADNLTIQNCYIKGAYFEKLTDSTFTNSKFINNGTDPDKVEDTFTEWMSGIDINLKNGTYKNINFTDCEFSGNGANSGTALLIKARDDGSYGSSTALDGVTVTGCSFTGNNGTAPIILGEKDKENKTPVNVQIQSDVPFTNNLAENAAYDVVFNSNGGSAVATMVVAKDATITLPTTTRSGYTFEGWYNDDTRVYSPYQVTADTTLVAHWKQDYNGKNNYPVTIKNSTNGTVSVAKADEYANPGETIVVTVTPDAGYKLDKLTVSGGVDVTDNEDGTYSFTMPASAVTITATFVEDPDYVEPTPEPEPTPDPTPSMPFTDVNEGDWFYDVVQYAYENGLMTGTSATTFEPNTSTTRGMIVAVLNRLEGGPTAEAAGFTDVNNGDWYADAVNWAASVGIVNGFEDNTFRANDPITREQMAAILYNYADYKGYDVSDRADLSGYADADSISSWALDTLEWANAEGLITGMSADTIAPQGQATRAQVAAMFERFIENIAE